MEIKELCCFRNIVLILLVILVVLILINTQPSITIMPHLYEHPSGECHIDSECDFGEICHITCLEFAGEACVEREIIGECTTLCSTNEECESGICEKTLLWTGLSGIELKLCRPVQDFE